MFNNPATVQAPACPAQAPYRRADRRDVGCAPMVSAPTRSEMRPKCATSASATRPAKDLLRYEVVLPMARAVVGKLRG